jgi:23S rRNA (guanosine2251-2'-O)-methyltransferase
MQKKGERFIYGVQSVRAVLEKRPGEVKELIVAARETGSAGQVVAAEFSRAGGHGARRELAERARGLGIEVREAAGREIRELTGADSSQGIAARAELPGYAELAEVMEREPHVVVVLDSITDPHNLGAIVRSAEALGASGVVIGKDRSAGITAAVHKASAGALEWLPLARVVNISRALTILKDRGYWVYGADPEAGNSLENTEFSDRCALVIGSESRGIREGVKKQLDFRVKIMQRGRTKSLNASVASAIILFTALRTRRY